MKTGQIQHCKIIHFSWDWLFPYRFSMEEDSRILTVGTLPIISCVAALCSVKIIEDHSQLLLEVYILGYYLWYFLITVNSLTVS